MLGGIADIPRTEQRDRLLCKIYNQGAELPKIRLISHTCSGEHFTRPSHQSRVDADETRTVLYFTPRQGFSRGFTNVQSRTCTPSSYLVPPVNTYQARLARVVPNRWNTKRKAVPRPCVCTLPRRCHLCYFGHTTMITFEHLKVSSPVRFSGRGYRISHTF